jgi:hypothetical protein
MKRRADSTTELLTDIRTAIAQIQAGYGITNRRAKVELRKRFTSVKVDVSELTSPGA